MSAPRRLSPEEARREVRSGALLVCAYPSDAMFRRAALEGAISFRAFERRKPSLSREQALIFY